LERKNKRKYAKAAIRTIEDYGYDAFVFQRGWDFIQVVGYDALASYSDSYESCIEHRSSTQKRTGLTYEEIDICMVCAFIDEAISMLDEDEDDAFIQFSCAMRAIGEVYATAGTRETIFELQRYEKQFQGRKNRAKRTKIQSAARTPIFEKITIETNKIYCGCEHLNATTAEDVTDIIIEKVKKKDTSSSGFSEWDVWTANPAKVTR